MLCTNVHSVAYAALCIKKFFLIHSIGHNHCVRLAESLRKAKQSYTVIWPTLGHKKKFFVQGSGIFQKVSQNLTYYFVTHIPEKFLDPLYTFKIKSTGQK